MPPGYSKKQRTKRSRKYIKPNPPRGAVKIYDDLIEIRALKGADSHFPNEPFKHEFDIKTKVTVYGLPDGSLRIIGEKPLWKWFEYSDADIEHHRR